MSATIERLSQTHLEALRGFLGQDPVHNLYLLGVLEDYGIEPKPEQAPFAFFGLFQGTSLTGALFVGNGGGLVLPSAGSPERIEQLCKGLPEPVQLRGALGERASVDVLVRYLCPTKPRVSLVQSLFAVSADDLGPFTNPTLRLATEDDLPKLVPLAGQAVKETLRRDPLADDPEAFTARVRQRVKARRTYVLPDGDRLVFKVDIGSRSRFGAELEGLYTIPEERRRGHATLSLGQLCRSLLSALPRLTLRADENDVAIPIIARKVGFHAKRPQRLVVAD